MPEMFADQFYKSLAHQARLSGTGDASHSSQRSSGNATDRFLRLLRVTPSIRSHPHAARGERWRGFSSPNR
jgi:hypothetical protein